MSMGHRRLSMSGRVGRQNRAGFRTGGSADTIMRRDRRDGRVRGWLHSYSDCLLRRITSIEARALTARRKIVGPGKGRGGQEKGEKEENK